MTRIVFRDFFPFSILSRPPVRVYLLSVHYRTPPRHFCVLLLVPTTSPLQRPMSPTLHKTCTHRRLSEIKGFSFRISGSCWTAVRHGTTGRQLPCFGKENSPDVFVPPQILFLNYKITSLRLFDFLYSTICQIE